MSQAREIERKEERETMGKTRKMTERETEGEREQTTEWKADGMTAAPDTPTVPNAERQSVAVNHTVPLFFSERVGRYKRTVGERGMSLTEYGPLLLGDPAVPFSKVFNLSHF